MGWRWANRLQMYEKYAPCPHWPIKAPGMKMCHMKYGKVLLFISYYHMLKHQDGQKALIMVQPYVYLFCLTSLECHKVSMSCPYCWATWKSNFVIWNWRVALLHRWWYFYFKTKNLSTQNPMNHMVMAMSFT